MEGLKRIKRKHTHAAGELLTDAPCTSTLVVSGGARRATPD